MDARVMVVLIVALALAAGVVNRWLKLRAGQGGTRVAELEARLAALEGLDARVRTLESIVTDPRVRLGEEIDALGGSDRR